MTNSFNPAGATAVNSTTAIDKVSCSAERFAAAKKSILLLYKCTDQLTHRIPVKRHV